MPARHRQRRRSATSLSYPARTLGDLVVSCLQESRIAFGHTVIPFVIQAVVTRVWVPAPGDMQRERFVQLFGKALNLA